MKTNEEEKILSMSKSVLLSLDSSANANIDQLIENFELGNLASGKSRAVSQDVACAPEEFKENISK